MTLQIFGHDKCAETRKAKMFFQERKISFQYINIKDKSPSAGEWNRIFKSIKPADLLDSAGKRYKDKGLAWKEFDPAEELAEDPLLARTPIVRSDSGTTCGYTPDTWKTWKDC